MHTTTDGVLSHPPIGVLHLTISFARGGRRDAIVTLAAASRRHGVVPHLATLRGDPADHLPFRDAFEDQVVLGIEARPTWRQLRDLRDHCVARGIRIVHAHDAASQFVASTLRTVAPSLHVVMTFHRSLGFESAGWRNRLRNAATLTVVDRVLTASDERRAHFIAENWVPAAKVTTIPLGIDLDRFKPDPAARRAIREEFGVRDDELLLVSAGHYGPEKGLDVAIEAVARARDVLAARPIGLRHLHLGTGDPDQQARIADRVAAAGGATTLVGQRPDPERFFAAGDLMVHTPRLEAFGLVLVQGMACGMPVIATSVGGIPEIVVPEVGRLVEPEQSAAAGDAIAAVLADPASRAALANGALERARTEYAASTFAQRHRALYERILGI